MSAPGGVSGPRGVSAPEGVCSHRGVSGPRGGIPGCTEADPPVNRMTERCKNITLPQTSFADGNNGPVTCVQKHQTELFLWF